MAFLAFAVRLAFVLKGNPAFNCDEALTFQYLRHLDNSKDFFIPAPFHLRTLLIRVFFILSGGWIWGGALAGITLNLLVCGLWILLIRRDFSREAAWGAAIFLAIPPASIAYYGVLNEARVETLLYGAVLLLWFEAWLKNIPGRLTAGFMIGWAFFVDPFILFFLLAVPFYYGKRIISNKRSPWPPILFPLTSGLLAGGFSGWFNLHQETIFSSGYYQQGLASFESIRHNLYFLLTAFPQWWNANMPFGYLQSTSFASSIQPFGTTFMTSFFGPWTGASFAILLAGSLVALNRVKKYRNLSSAFWLPAMLFLAFFVLSRMTWDALCFRYLAFLMIVTAFMFGLTAAEAFHRGPKLGTLVLVAWILIQGGLLVRKLERLPFVHPAQVIAGCLEKYGFHEAYAHLWASHTINYLSNDEIHVLSYNQLPMRRSVLKMVQSANRVGFVVFEGLDQPETIQKAFRCLVEAGYRQGKIFDFGNGLTICEFVRPSRR